MSPADRDTARAQLEDQLARMEQASALHRHDWLVLKDAIAQALAEVRAENTERSVVLERAVGNCFMMAKRQISAHLNGTSTTQQDLERWQHVQRFCETTGSKSDILRGQLPTEITEGSAVAPPALERREETRTPQEIERVLGFDPTNHHNALGCPYCNHDKLKLERREAQP